MKVTNVTNAYQARKAAGLCVRPGCYRKPKLGREGKRRSYCTFHNAQNAKHAAAWIARHATGPASKITLAEPTDPQTLMKECYRFVAGRYQQLPTVTNAYQARKAAGLCVRPGCYRKPKLGREGKRRSYCTFHNAQNAKHAAAWIARHATGPASKITLAEPTDPQTLMKECYRFVAGRYQQLPTGTKVRPNWMRSFVEMLLAEHGIGTSQTFTPQAVPESFRLRGRKTPAIMSQAAIA